MPIKALLDRAPRRTGSNMVARKDAVRERQGRGFILVTATGTIRG